MATYETIWYPVVWEKEKLADNVIGYNIREEQSISDYSVLTWASSVSNWQATLVYWVNAPKIIADTSIVWDLWWFKPIWAKIEWSWDGISRPTDTLINLKYQTISEQYWDDGFTKFTWADIYTSWILIPATWTYEIDAIYNTASSTFGWRYDYKKALWGWSASPTIHSFTWPYSSSQSLYVETFRIVLEEWDVIRMVANVLRTSSTPLGIPGWLFATTNIKRIS